MFYLIVSVYKYSIVSFNFLAKNDSISHLCLDYYNTNDKESFNLFSFFFWQTNQKNAEPDLLSFHFFYDYQKYPKGEQAIYH